MVGPLNTPPPLQGAPDTGPQGGRRGFFSSTAGKLTIGLVVVVLLVGALGVVAYLYIFNRAADLVSDVVAEGAAQGSATATAPVEVPAQRRGPRLSDTFTFRNVFAPTLRPAKSSTESSDTTSGVPADLPDNTLFLQSISVVDGEPVGTFVWNGTTFAAGEGETLAGTPWKVLSLDGDNATMLFGDQQVTLTVGQATGK